MIEFLRHQTQLCFITFIWLYFYLMKSLDCVDVIAQKENYLPDYKMYHNLSLLGVHLKELSQHYPNYVKLSDQYRSRNGRSQYFTRVSNFSNGDDETKKKIFLAFGEHAREFLPVESLMYFLSNLTSGTSCVTKKCDQTNYSYKFSSWVLSNFDIYIVAMTNPDGREYIEKTHNYCWRGTARGVDLNRNFNWSYGERGSSSNPKDDEYRGPYAFSEPETWLFQQITRDISMDAFVSFHSGFRHIYMPYADSLSRESHRFPFNKDHMTYLVEKLATASPLRKFHYGVASELVGYVADGTSLDYMSGVRKIPFSLVIELWEHRRHRGRSCFDQFNPHSNSLQKELALIHPLYVELLLYLDKWKAKYSPDITAVDDDNDIKLHIENNAPVHSDLLLLGSVAALILLYLILKQLLWLIRYRRLVSIRSLSSTFSLLKCFR